MHYSIIILSFFLFPFQLFSQFENTGFEVAINNSYPLTTYQYPLASKPLPARDKSQNTFAYHIDIHTFYKINSKLSIKTGAGFIKKKFLDNIKVRFSDQVTIKRGFDHPNNDVIIYPKEIKYFTSLNYINLPIGINYLINSKWELGAGLQNNFLLSAYDYSVYKYENGDRKSNFNRKYFRNDLYASYAMSGYVETNYHFHFIHFPLSAKVQLGYGVSNYFSKKIPGTLHPISINIGLAIKFKR